MRVLGITAEYNPFHNGHKYHLEQSVEMTDADYVVAVMSGNFTQRGEPAILDKWTRSRLAVESGVDLVIELPFLYACSRAENFAKGAVDILAGIGATHISFGSESGELEELRTLAEALVERSAQLAEKRGSFMKEGRSYAKANEMAVEAVFGKESARLLLSPNNILAVEYLKRILYWDKQGHSLEAVTVKRCGAGYFDADEASGFAGASYIRRLFEEQSGGDDPVDGACRDRERRLTEILERFMPSHAVAAMMEKYSVMGDAGPSCVNTRFFDVVRAEILKNDAEELAQIYCVGEGLENRFKREIMKAENLDELVSAMVSRRYTESAIRRMLVYILLGIREKTSQHALYGRVLAAGDGGQQLLKKLRKQEISRIPLITNVNKATELSPEVRAALHYDVLASDMYNLLHGRELYGFSDKVITPYMESKKPL